MLQGQRERTALAFTAHSGVMAVAVSPQKVEVTGVMRLRQGQAGLLSTFSLSYPLSKVALGTLSPRWCLAPTCYAHHTVTCR